MRYKTDDQFFEQFDSRRLVDARFFLFMGVISNSLFQIQSMLNPLPGTNQFQVNIIYCGFTICSATCCALSFKNIKWVLYGLIIHTIRNICPVFDPEGRRYVMKPEAWTLLVNFQIQAVGIYIMLINNSLDQGMFIVGALLTIAIFLGMLSASYGLSDTSVI